MKTLLKILGGWGDLETLRTKAEAGDAAALADLGWMYAKGKCGVRQDEAKAVELLCQAAGQGCDEASYHLGKMFVAGKVVCVGAKAREIIRLALKPFSKRHPATAGGANRTILFAVYRPRVGRRASPHPGLGVAYGHRAARERDTENPVRRDDQWTENHGH